jgi:hypothetical protein
MAVTFGGIELLSTAGWRALHGRRTMPARRDAAAGTDPGTGNGTTDCSVVTYPAALRRGTDFTGVSADPIRAGVFAVSSRSIMISGAGYRCGR